MACPSRKTSLKLKRLQSQHITFADSVKISHSTPMINSDIVCKSIYLLVSAMLKNVDNPGTSPTELNALHKLNGLPTLNLTGCMPPSLNDI